MKQNMKNFILFIGVLTSLGLLSNLDLFNDKILYSSDSEDYLETSERILFVSRIAGQEELCSVKPDGSSLKQLTKKESRSEYQPHFSKDNRYITFNTYRYGGWKLAKATSDLRSVNKLIKNSVGYEYDASWSNNGNYIAYIGFDAGRSGKRQVFITDTKGINPKNITKNYKQFSHYAPVFSKDDKMIYCYAVSENGSYDLFSMNIDGSNRKNISNTATSFEFAPSISPDNSKLAYLNFNEVHNNIDVLVLDLKTNKIVNLTAKANLKSPLCNWESPFFAYAVDWSPDGKTLVFNSDADGDLDIYTIKSDGTVLKKITNNDWDDAQPNWSN